MKGNYVTIDLALVIEKLVLIIAVTFLVWVAARMIAMADRKWLHPSPGTGVKDISESLFGATPRLLVKAAAVLMLVVSIMISTVIPWGEAVRIGSRNVSLFIARVDIGVLLILAFLWLGIYGGIAQRWSYVKNDRIGALFRFGSLFIACALAMGLAIVPLLMLAASTDLQNIISLQKDAVWNIFYQLPGFLIMLLGTAVLSKPSFTNDGRRIAGAGFGSVNAMYNLTGYVLLFLMGTFITALYLGGYEIPFVSDLALRRRFGVNVLFILQGISFSFKIIMVVAILLWTRRVLERYDESILIRWGWKLIIPAALINLAGTAVVLVA
ncbi:MAG: NADH-quinone oxidoreductase subunit H [Chitinophagaceae bacterium]|nr:NADH-quinone oxidoreductase subunit H [Chitinophagaceae bacterium]MCO5286951.1 NADH-quinone oxidoreductase subunit H [Chitinophagaceae bacterium]MCZ2397936.1 NADH-quinone oxidoreductase subunit H [Chitinophagales bacterium]